MRLKPSRKSSLLEELQAKVGCMYISDLRHSDLLPSIHQALREMDYTSYLLWEWCDAVRYIRGSDIPFEQSVQAYYYLLGFTDAARSLRDKNDLQSDDS